ncbi:MAG: M12 family metallo-peptidase [Candidatus Kapabacteria bacterium]|nr:M12 family metallo-peptidase [Candidatus Kapabacteria bacterium]
MIHKAVFSLIFLLTLCFSGLAVKAQTTLDARSLFIPAQASKNSLDVQTNGYIKSMMLQHSVARSVFEKQDRYVTLKNFELPGDVTGDLVLVRTRAVFDANTEFYTHTKAGKVAMKIRPVVSYIGTVNGDRKTKVSIHYSEGEITGYIQTANRKLTLIGRDFSKPRSEGATAHTIADEETMLSLDPIARFICASEDRPLDPETVIRSMSIAPKAKNVEASQADYLREFKLAVGLREDIDSAMKARGQTDEEITQYFVKIVAAVSQTFEQELDATIYLTYFEKYTKDEPTGYFYDGRNIPSLIQEFARDWSQSHNSVNRTVAHLFALYRGGGSNVLGIGYLGQMCNKKNDGGYSVTGMFMNASQIPGDPKRSNAYVSDVEVVAHEIGHNIGAYHTHNCYWSPPIDTCMLQSDGTDACFKDANLRHIVDGTIMSYCEDVNGERVPMTYGDKVGERMRGWMAAAPCNLLITSPAIHISEPRGSGLYNLGEKMTIRWSSARVSTVNISWGGSDKGPWTNIATNVDAADRQYLWTIPGIPVSPFWIRISDATNEAVRDTSIASYRINIPVVLDAPKGGERVGGGSAFNIRWTKGAGVGNVKLEFAPDGVTFETLLASSSATSYTWTVPIIATENARVRVFAFSSPDAPSTSGAFAIGVRRYALEIPAENASLCKNQLNQYRWSADFIPTIRIQYSTDDGANWRNATQQSTIEASMWQVFSRNINMSGVPKGTKLKLRVIDATTEEVLDTRNNLTMDSCDAPVSVSEVAEDVPFAITSVSPNPASSVVRIGLATSESRQYDIILISSEGRELVLRSDVSIASGSTIVEVPLNNVAAGSYRIAVRGDGMQVVAPVVVIR